MIDVFQMYKDNILKEPVAIVSAIPVSGHRVIVTFNTGETKIYDFTPLLDRPVFQPLQDEVFFREKMFLDYDTVAWPGNIDIDPEDVYEDAEPLRRLSTLEEPFTNIPQHKMVG